MASLADYWRNLTRGPEQKIVPAVEAIPRLRESSALLPAIRVPPPAANPEAAPTPIPPPAWADVFPVHHRELFADLRRRGEDPANWEVQDGRDLGVSEAGHTVAFRLHKTNTSVTIQIELTLFKGTLAKVRVR